MTSPNDFLLGGTGRSVTFGQIGDAVTGTIVSTEVRQQTDLATGKPVTWDNGDPKLQLVVALQTSERDPGDADDDGVRNLYVKGSKKAGTKSLHDAVATAVRMSGAKGLEPGGTLTVRYIGEEPSQTRGFNPRKLYEATYSPPDAAQQTGDFLGTAPPAQRPEPNGGASPVDTAKHLIAAGVTDDVIAASTGLDRTVIAALRNAA